MSITSSSHRLWSPYQTVIVVLRTSRLVTMSLQFKMKSGGYIRGRLLCACGPLLVRNRQNILIRREGTCDERGMKI